MPLKPLICICGTTGVGKSKLAVELALRISQSAMSPEWHSSRVINADAMQVYRGLDVLTNKIPESERRGIEHLLMDFKSPNERYIVGDWVEDAIQKIDEMHGRAEVPVVVGGTSYWLQHLMFSNRLSSAPRIPANSTTKSDDNLPAVIQALSPDMRGLLEHLPDPTPSATESPDLALALYDLLLKIDPLIAGTWHWRDTRKVLRSLSIIKETGQRPSTLYREQSAQAALPRYNTLCFWLHADMKVLEPRLRLRVDDMLQNGLLDEVSALQNFAAKDETATSQPDYTSGIYQSIGFKEFHRYLSEPEQRISEYDLAVENMKISTRQYAKRQVTWIRNKLIPAVNAARRVADANPHFYALDAADLDAWPQNVSQVATQITTSFLNNDLLPDPCSISPIAQDLLREGTKSAEYVQRAASAVLHFNDGYSPIAMLEARRQIVCSTCTVDKSRPIMIIEGEAWNVHCRTKVHRKLAKKAGCVDSAQDWPREPDV